MAPNHPTACEAPKAELPILCNRPIEERLVQNALSALAKATNKPRIKEFEAVPRKDGGVVGTGGRVPDRTLGGYAQIDNPDKIQPAW